MNTIGLFKLEFQWHDFQVSGSNTTLILPVTQSSSRLRLKCDCTRTETRFSLSAKQMSPFKSAAASVQSTIGSWGVRISGSNVGYTMFRDSVKGNGYPLHSPVSPSLSLPCVTVCHHISPGLYYYSPASTSSVFIKYRKNFNRKNVFP